jgi:hypothetical protein
VGCGCAAALVPTAVAARKRNRAGPIDRVRPRWSIELALTGALRIDAKLRMGGSPFSLTFDAAWGSNVTGCFYFA